MTGILRQPFGTTPDGRTVEQYTLRNARGMSVSVLSLGGIVRSLSVPDARGIVADVVLGFDTLGEYLADHMYVGALIGRYANRIAGARFTLDGTEYRLPPNAGPNQLHGGPAGFNRAHWDVVPQEDDAGAELVLRYFSPDGESGYPGTLDVTVTYALTDFSQLVIAYEATADRATPVNFTFHGYFNLGGHGAGSVLDHRLTLGASRFTPIDALGIPTGELRAVEGTPFDFRHPRAIGVRLAEPNEQLTLGHGYDHNFVIDSDPQNDVSFAARVMDPRTGRWMEIFTTEPGVQLYPGQGLNTVGKDGCAYGPHAGVALETQHFPDSPNEPSFPTTILQPGQTFTSRTVYRFGA